MSTYHRDYDESIQYKPRHSAPEQPAVGFVKKTSHTKYHQVAVDPFIQLVVELHTYRVVINRKSLKVDKSGFVSLKLAQQYRDEQLAKITQ